MSAPNAKFQEMLKRFQQAKAAAAPQKRSAEPSAPESDAKRAPPPPSSWVDSKPAPTQVAGLAVAAKPALKEQQDLDAAEAAMVGTQMSSLGQPDSQVHPSACQL